jgi:hypothetical protein
LLCKKYSTYGNRDTFYSYMVLLELVWLEYSMKENQGFGFMVNECYRKKNHWVCSSNMDMKVSQHLDEISLAEEGKNYSVLMVDKLVDP